MKNIAGPGKALIFVYGILGISATARSLVQVLRDFSHAPLAYSLSAVAALVYVVATIALVLSTRMAGMRIVAWVAVITEFIGVLTVGTLSLFMPEAFAISSVWAWFGRDYGFVPLVLPILGMWWLHTEAVRRKSRENFGSGANDGARPNDGSTLRTGESP